MIDDYLEDDAELDRHTVEELEAWIKFLGMKLTDKHGETVPLSMVGHIAELGNTTRVLRENIARLENRFGRPEPESDTEELVSETEANDIFQGGMNPGISAAEAMDTFGISIKRLDE